MSGPGEVRAIPVLGIPEVRENDPLGELVAERSEPRDGDVLVISQKAVSKAEGRLVQLAGVEPGEEARRLAAEQDKDPAVVELILRESTEVMRAERRVIICRTRHGFVCANAGVDTSNVPAGFASLLPEDPDSSARRIRSELRKATGATVAVIVADSFGRAWRHGQAEVAIGCAGLEPLDDWRDRRDPEGHVLNATLIAIADEAAAAADLVRDKTSGTPAVLVRGLERYAVANDGPGAAALRRPRAEDLFP